MVLGLSTRTRPLMKPAPESTYPTPDRELRLAVESGFEIGMTPLSPQEINELREMLQ
jgi:hypothetical protein